MASKNGGAPLSVSNGKTSNTAVLEAEEYVLGEDVTHLAKATSKKKVAPRTIAIVGFAETSRMQVLTEPDTTEIWSLNRCYTFLKRWDRHFEIHEQDLYMGKTGLREDNYMDLMRSWTCPIYMQHLDPSVPTALQFPKDEIIHDLFPADGEEGFDYFTTSIAYMLAMIAYEHQQGQTVGAMHIYGVDMSAFSEYSEQLPCVNFWLGVLKGMGIKVVIPSVSPLLKCAMQYGRQGEKPLQKMAKERLQSHKDRQAQLLSECAGATGIANEYGNIFKTLDDMIAQVEKEELDPIQAINVFKDACKNRRNDINQYNAQCNADLNAAMGGLREVQHWMVAFNAAQTEDEEPAAAKLPKFGQ